MTSRISYSFQGIVCAAALSGILVLPHRAEANAVLCGRGSAGLDCAVSDQGHSPLLSGKASTFGAATTWSTAFSDANSWNTGAQYYSTIQLVKLNNDDHVDVCGRGRTGIVCALGTGTGFGPTTTWADAFSDANGWTSPQYYSTIQFIDLNGDGLDDVCGRGRTGLDCALNTGTGGFGPVTTWEPDFSDANGWNRGPEYYSTIRFVHLSSLQLLDVCARGRAGVNCATNLGNRFAATTTWSPDFSDANGWNQNAAYYSTIQFADVNGDGSPDVCGRGRAGVVCGKRTGGRFGSATVWLTEFSDANGWLNPAYYSTIKLVDMNIDGAADVCGRGPSGIHCAMSNRSTGFAFEIDPHGIDQWFVTGFSDSNGWNAAEYYSTIQYKDVDGDQFPDVCGRSPAGFACSVNLANERDTAKLLFIETWQPAATAFSDANRWNSDAAYYSTLRIGTGP